MNWSSSAEIIKRWLNPLPESMAPPQTDSPEEEDLAHALEARSRFPQCPSNPMCVISVRDQALRLIAGDKIVCNYTVSTSRYGTGGQLDSFKTPIGAHRIAERIGEGVALHTIFKGRVAQEGFATVEMRPQQTGEDHITTRILWLDGLEPGINQGGNVDSMQRYIYIHGTHEEGLLGQAASVGCIRMRAEDVVELFDQVRVGTLVLILP